jgi:hypothetical protein
MRFGGSQFAHLEVASLMRSMYLRWALPLPFVQDTRRAGRGLGLGITSNRKSHLYKHRPSKAILYYTTAT